MNYKESETLSFRRNVNPDPIFEERAGAFVTKIFRAESLHSKVEKSSEKSSEKILEMIEKSPRITINQLSEHLNISTRYVEKIISELKKEKRLIRVGGRKDGEWRIQ